MKTMIIIGDGIADYPLNGLGNRTPLMAAHKPNIDRLAQLGRCGRLMTIPANMPTGSEVAYLSILGYNVQEVNSGCGAFEAESLGVKLGPDDLAMHCSFITIRNGNIKLLSDGDLFDEEGRELIDSLNNIFSKESQQFHAGNGQRNLFVLKNGSKFVNLTPPYEVQGQPWKTVLPVANHPDGKLTTEILKDLINRSQGVLERHPVNIERVKNGKEPANLIWFWSAGKKPQMKSFTELYGKSGAVISNLDLLNGIGIHAGFKVIKMEGTVGSSFHNYDEKVDAALNAIEEVDLVVLHFEDADEAGHEGNIERKVKCIEALDDKVINPLMKRTMSAANPFSISFLPNHPTPCSVRTHTYDPVPFVIYAPGELPDVVDHYDEESVFHGAYGLVESRDFIWVLFDK